MIPYFEKRSKTYKLDSAKIPWRITRQQEFDVIVRLLEPQKGESLLDLGCGAGYYAIPLQKNFQMNVLGIDSSPGMLKNLESEGIRTELSKIENLSLTEQFDKILAAGLLEFMTNPDALFKKCSEILGNNGKLVILAPTTGIAGWIYKKAHEWVGCPAYIRPLSEYEAFAAQYGFAVENKIKCTPLSVALSFRR